MLIDEAQAQRTAAIDRGSEQNSPELDNGAEINTAATGRTKAEALITIDAVINRKTSCWPTSGWWKTKGPQGLIT